MKMFPNNLTIVLFLFSIPTSLLGGQLLVSEALVNEPGAQTTLEWFELVNAGPGGANLDDYSIIVNGTTLTGLPAGRIIPEATYLVVSRNLISFESVWGDNSGVWGDDSLLESYDVVQASFQLVNAAGRISVSTVGATSILAWPSAGADGFSWELIAFFDSSAQQSIRVLGTPGRANSRMRPERDWRLLNVNVFQLRDFGAILEIFVNNAGDSSLPATRVLITLNPDTTGGSVGILAGDSLACENIPALVPKQFVAIRVNLSLQGFYARTGILIRGSDDRPENNFDIITAPGMDFPAVIINEFLPDPKDPQTVEWVELKNVSPENFDLANWALGDNMRFKNFGQSSIPIMAGEYAILTQNRFDFLQDYPEVSPLIVHEVPWSVLNNTFDSVRLLDKYQIRSDQFGYSSVWGGNITWSRGEESGMTDLWGRSAVTGGTPGDSNLTLLNPTGEALALEISPDPFSPDGDLIDDTAYIRIEATMGDGMQARVFDRDGRLVRTLFDGQPFGGRLAWDGMTDAGRRAPIGIYIVYVEISGAGSAKKTVVIAR